jgi:hypothetical protein
MMDCQVAFAVAGIMPRTPNQVSELMLWINILGASAGIALIAWELKARRAHVRA